MRHWLALTLVDPEQGARRPWLVQAERIVLVEGLTPDLRADAQGAATRITVDCCEGYSFFVDEELAVLRDWLTHLEDSDAHLVAEVRRLQAALQYRGHRGLRGRTLEEALVIAQRWHSGACTLAQLADDTGLSKDAVRQLIAEADYHARQMQKGHDD